MNHTLLKYESKGKALLLPSCDIRQMLSKETRWAADVGMFKKEKYRHFKNLFKLNWTYL